MLRKPKLCAYLFLVTNWVSYADDKKETPKSETIIKLTVEAKSPTKPALKYLLLPDVNEMTPGNAYPAYLKCFAEQSNYFYAKESIERQGKWLESSLQDLPEEVRQYTVRGPMGLLDRAARMESIDWQVLQDMKRDGVFTLLPDVQILRNLASWNKIRIRFQVKENRFADAIYSVQSMFALARHFSEHPTLIGHLVGVAIANMAIQPLEELIQQPSAPNLFWSLHFLPAPLVPIEKGLRAEQMFVVADFGSLLNKAQIWDQDAIAKAREKCATLGTAADLGKEKMETISKWASEKLTDEGWLKITRKRLVDLGYPEAKVAKYPPEQVIVYHLVESYFEARDERAKWSMLPLWQTEEKLIEIDENNAKDTSIEGIVGNSFTPAIVKVTRASARLEQRLGLLKHVEAIRIYAAENNGKLPEKLADIKLPLPIDPMTGRPFGYQLKGDTAIIQGTPSKGDANNPVLKVSYHVTIKK